MTLAVIVGVLKVGLKEPKVEVVVALVVLVQRWVVEGVQAPRGH